MTPLHSFVAFLVSLLVHHREATIAVLGCVGLLTYLGCFFYALRRGQREEVGHG